MKSLQITRRHAVLGGLAFGASSYARSSQLSDKFTPDFVRIADSNRWLWDRVQYVGRLLVPVNLTKDGRAEKRFVRIGSATLLKQVDDGIFFVCSSHQTTDARMIMKEYSQKPNDNPNEVGIPIEIWIRTLTEEVTVAHFGRLGAEYPDQDVALGKVSLDDRKNLAPLQIWTGRTNELFGSKVIICGYPRDADGKLHATEGTITGKGNDVIVGLRDRTNIKVLKCALMANAEGINGMSGGAAFTDGKLVGILSAGLDSAAASVLVPFSYMLDIFNKIPGSKLLEVSDDKLACHFISQDFRIIPDHGG